MLFTLSKKDQLIFAMTGVIVKDTLKMFDPVSSHFWRY